MGVKNGPNNSNTIGKHPCTMGVKNESNNILFYIPKVYETP
jgi:hypothetical protein